MANTVHLQDAPPLVAQVDSLQLGDLAEFTALIAASFLGVLSLYVLETVVPPKGFQSASLNFARFAAKGAASVAFVAAAGNILASAPTITVEHASLFVALILCAVGDLLLVVERSFVPGVLTFLAGHMAFGASFVAHGVTLGRCALALPVVLPVLIGVKRHLYPHVPGGLLRIVHLYSAAICIMAVLAAGTGRPILFGAALLFIVSDIGVGQGAFIKTTAGTRASVFLYYSAQAVFAWSMFPGTVAALLPAVLAEARMLV
uniref:YhhN-like protein n=1 Tax=Neobodo designis TaxID=312471 RepID=A0A7S1W248_NEODS|mmetsp:Transcript_49644/g.153325  ORF Transcript_49644/g.153325 Transcript_49644/m.153325 type:complete len:260 (+) Transcript_49644:65-844(+)|eukprot:CAMPEP_0174851922 /NCGR_PEP_ID=MMETSP1114-20130205/24529_1 /TAXON_ID=312471 /ORGANISM="Neobodo designis, Strain CCAP 1951/1" /LENGTH=259 /DNA_ID=CAMNT_0016086489 /DNA_START=65 /DNA_END=844 /DNA_ORIENTATION=+